MDSNEEWKRGNTKCIFYKLIINSVLIGSNVNKSNLPESEFPSLLFLQLSFLPGLPPLLLLRGLLTGGLGAAYVLVPSGILLGRRRCSFLASPWSWADSVLLLWSIVSGDMFFIDALVISDRGGGDGGCGIRSGERGLVSCSSKRTRARVPSNSMLRSSSYKKNWIRIDNFLKRVAVYWHLKKHIMHQIMIQFCVIFFFLLILEPVH